MEQRSRKAQPDPEDKYLFADLDILAYIERSQIGGPSIDYFEHDVKWYYEEHRQRNIPTSEINIKLQRFWYCWHAPGDNPYAWQKIYDLGLNGLPRLPEEQKERVRQRATELKDGITGTPRRTRSDSVLPRALLSPATRSSRDPVASSDSSRVRKNRKGDESPTKRRVRTRITPPATTRRTPNSRTPVRALSTSLGPRPNKHLSKMKVELVSSPSPSEQMRKSTEQTCDFRMMAQLDELRGENARVTSELDNTQRKNTQIVSELDNMKGQVNQLKLSVEDLRYQKANDNQYWKRLYRETLEQRDSLKRQYKELQADQKKDQGEIASDNRLLQAKNDNLQNRLDSCRGVLQFKEHNLDDFSAQNMNRVVEHVDQLALKLNIVLQGQDALFAIEQLDCVKNSGISSLFKRAFGLGFSLDDSGRGYISTTAICRNQLRLVVSSLISAALCKWVFEAEVGALFQENNLAYAKLQSLLAAAGRVPLLNDQLTWSANKPIDKELTRSFEFAAHEKCIDDPLIRERAIPGRAQHLARQVRDYIMPLLEAHKDLDKQYADIINEWLDADRLLAKVFEEALHAKVNLLLSTYKYKCTFYVPGTPFDKETMDNIEGNNGNSTNGKVDELVEITIFPGIIRYTSTDDFNYNRFFGAKKAPKRATPEVLRQALVLAR